MQHLATDTVVDYTLAFEIEADTGTDKMTIRAAHKDGCFSLPEMAVLLEEIEVFIDDILHKEDIRIEPFGTTGVDSKTHDAQIFEQENSTALAGNIKSLVSQFTDIAVEEIGMDTSLIQIGIDSLVAIKFAKFLCGKGVQVSSAELVKHNRLGALCRHVRLRDHQSSAITQANKDNECKQENGKGSGASFPESTESLAYSSAALGKVLAINGVTGLDAKTCTFLPCTPLQIGMLTQGLATNGSMYLHHHAIRCDPALDLERLKAAWESLVASTKLLRTTFHWVPFHNIPWIAAVHPSRRPSWTSIEVSDPRDYCLQLGEQSDFKSRIRNLEPLAGVQIVKSKDDLLIIFTLHHSIYDGISLKLLFQHLVLRYHGVDEPPIAPFSAIAQQIALKRQLSTDFWIKRISDYKGIAGSRAVKASESVLRERLLVPDNSNVIEDWRHNGYDDKAVCMAAFGKALTIFSAQQDVVFGHVTAARHGCDSTEGDVIGPTFNTVPIRFNLADRLWTNIEVVRDIENANADSIEWQHASLSDVQRQWKSKLTDASANLMDSVFVYSKVDMAQADEIAAIGKPLHDDKALPQSEFRLNVELEHRGGTIVARALSTASPELVDEFLVNLEDSLIDIGKNPTRVATAFPQALRGLTAAIKPSLPSPCKDDADDLCIALFAPTIRSFISEIADVASEQISLDGSIYAFGIDSIAAIRLVSRCREADINISINDVLKGATLRGICSILGSRVEARTKSPPKLMQPQVALQGEAKHKVLKIANIPVEDVEEVLPCLAGQEYQIISWLRSDRTFFEHPWAYRSTELLEINRVKTAWSALRRDNSILRTTFAAIDSQRVAQIVLSMPSVENKGFSVLHTDIPVWEATRRIAQMESLNPSDLSTVPLRLCLIKGSDGDALCLQIHHALYDGLSMPLLWRDLAALYKGQVPFIPPRFSDLVSYLHGSQSTAENIAFWKTSLEGCDAAVFPVSKGTGAGLARDRAFAMVESQKIRIDRLNKAASHHNIPPHHVALLGIARTIAQQTLTANPIFGFTHLGRSAEFGGIEKVTAPCSNMLPLGLRDVERREVLESLREIQRVLIARVPFEQSHLRQAIPATQIDTAQTPFNAYVNILWHKASLTTASSDNDLLQPLDLGSVMNFSSQRAPEVHTAVDALDTTLLSRERVNIDVAVGERGLLLGVWADRVLLDDEGVASFTATLEEDILECVSALENGA